MRRQAALSPGRRGSGPAWVGEEAELDGLDGGPRAVGDGELGEDLLDHAAFAEWNVTVVGPSTSAPAISLFVRPCATYCSTSTSLGVSRSKGASVRMVGRAGARSPAATSTCRTSSGG